jgi:AcrR family transcriptional regulator
METQEKPLRERIKNAVIVAVLDAAEVCLIEKGFEKATMQDVAGRAGCAVGTIYLYFKSKDELFKAIVQRRLNEIQEEVQAAMAGGATPVDRLRIFVETHVRWAHRNVKFVNLICSVLPMRYYDFEARMHELMPDCNDQMRESLVDTMKAAQAAGEVRGDIQPETLLEMLHGIMVTLLDQFSAKPEKYTLEEQLHLTWQVMATGITGGRA